MRIAFASTNKVWGGGEQLLAHLITGAVRAGHEAALVARRAGPAAQWARDARLPLVLELAGLGRTPWSLWALRRWLRQHAFDVLVLNDPHSITSGGLAAWGLPTVRVGMRHTVFPVHSAWKHRALTDHLVCVSRAAQAECLKASIPARMLSVIYGAAPKVDVDPAHVHAIRELFVRSSRDGARRLLGVGSLLPVKGFDVTIRAVAQGVARGHDWHLWIAGEGPQRSALAALAAELNVADRVHWLGFRHDVASLLAAADVFVSASYSEGFSLVLVEAMQARCPIVSTAVGGCSETLGLDATGRTRQAEIFSPGDVAGLVAAIERTVDGSANSSSVRQQRIDDAHAWYSANFSIEHMARRHLALYARLLDETGVSVRSRRRAA